MLVPVAAFALTALGSATFIMMVGEGSPSLALLLVGLMTVTIGTVASVGFTLAYLVLRRLLGRSMVAGYVAGFAAAAATTRAHSPSGIRPAWWGFADGAPLEAVRAITRVAVANAPGRPAALGVAWVALPCETNPTLTIFAEGGRLRMILDRGPIVPRDCDAMGLVYGITLDLSQPIAARLVDIQAVSRD